jgi:tRNA pseudouridine13 synthase
LHVSKLEEELGIEVFATHSRGFGGIIKKKFEDFVVEEVLVDGSKADTSCSERNASSDVLGSKDSKGQYLLCVMVKRDWDTIRAVKAVGDGLGINPGKIQIAGIKDARAVTAQYVTIEGSSSEEVETLQVKDLCIHPVGFVRTKLSSYFLFGNSFQIIINGIKSSREFVKQEAARTVEEMRALGGVPNFFGHQRFGTIRPITHHVGKALVQGNFREAVMLFLTKPSHFEHPQSKEARQKLAENESFREAFRNFPKQLHYEVLMLRHLSENPTDFLGAYKRLPFILQELFVQSFQSFLFNRFLSSRLRQELPLNEAQVGDYVVKVDRSGLPMLETGRSVSEIDLKETSRSLREGSLRLAIPLIGFRQKPSMGVQGEIERQILDQEGISLHDFRIKDLPGISSRGRLRTALTPLRGFSFDLINNDRDGSEQAARVSFLLQRGSYATIVLRELMKPPNLIQAGF